MSGEEKIRIGDLLVQLGLIQESALYSAIEEQKKTGEKLGNILIQQGVITEEKLLNALSEQLQIPFFDLSQFHFNPKLVEKLPEKSARLLQAILLEEKDNAYLVGMSDPEDIFALDELKQILDKPIEPVLISEEWLHKSMDRLYRRQAEISGLAEKLSQQLKQTQMTALSNQMSEGDEAPVAQLIQSIFQDAIQINASDIHIEPDEQGLRIRLRVDGMLQEHMVPDKAIISALTQRLKLMSGLNIAEKRLPQDGRFQIQLHQKNLDVRLSTLPVQFGESVVMRLLDHSAVKLDLNVLGFPENLLAQFRKAISIPHGMILVTGPTGSGKTTTLYSALKELNTPTHKILTVEDPVEYRIPRICQVQVNSKIDLTFAKVLRSMLRQDPDIILVGEIRDSETAAIALRAALTGHLVLASLHTNDARSTAIRLIDMGAEPYLVAASLRAILTQRLVRRICNSCKIKHTPSVRERAWIRAHFKEKSFEGGLYKGAGCSHCHQTGYQGREGIFEFLVFNEEMIQALQLQQTVAFHEAINEQMKGQTLSNEAFQKAKNGVTSLYEVMRVTEDLL